MKTQSYLSSTFIFLALSLFFGLSSTLANAASAISAPTCKGNLEQITDRGFSRKIVAGTTLARKFMRQIAQRRNPVVVEMPTNASSQYEGTRYFYLFNSGQLTQAATSRGTIESTVMRVEMKNGLFEMATLKTELWKLNQRVPAGKMKSYPSVAISSFYMVEGANGHDKFFPWMNQDGRTPTVRVVVGTHKNGAREILGFFGEEKQALDFIAGKATTGSKLSEPQIVDLENPTEGSAYQRAFFEAAKMEDKTSLHERWLLSLFTYAPLNHEVFFLKNLLPAEKTALISRLINEKRHIRLIAGNNLQVSSFSGTLMAYNPQNSLLMGSLDHVLMYWPPDFKREDSPVMKYEERQELNLYLEQVGIIYTDR